MLLTKQQLMLNMDFGGDDTTVVTRKHGEKLNIKGGASTTAADLTAGNIAVLGDAATGTLNIRMAKALTGLSSATFTTPSGTTVINGGGMTITPSTTGCGTYFHHNWWHQRW